MINHDDVIAKGHFNFSGAQDKGIKLSNIGLDFAGGRISASPVTLMPNAKSISTSIELHQVQLDQL
ncbi:MAG TPA: hypothetical protein PLK94_03010, partial [Alphaproteobacteria bacterium]|nr:hypothetical protein [Alphaproteobacteria bacterium]